MRKRSFEGNQPSEGAVPVFSVLMIQKIAPRRRSSDTVNGTARGVSPTKPTSNAMPAGKRSSRKNSHCLESGALRPAMIMKKST